MRRLTPIEKQRGEQLAQFLNGEVLGLPETKYEDFLGWCQEVRSLYLKRPPLSRSQKRLAYERHQGTLRTEVNQFLRRFEVHPRLEAYESGLASTWAAVKHVPPEIARALRACKSGLEPITEHSAVHIILEMTVAGSIDRIRQCENPNCRKWIMALTGKKVVCDNACRFAKYAAKRDSRANDMARSRKLHQKNSHLKKQKGRKK